jgi:hypothetical protein
MYFTLISISQDLLKPEDIPFELPVMLDLALHLLPTVVLWIELLVFTPHFRYTSYHLILLALFTVGYSSWMELCFSKNGFWPYPFLAFLDGTQRLILYAGAFALTVVFYHAGTSVHKSVQEALGRSLTEGRKTV